MSASGAADEWRGETPGQADEDEAEDVVNDGGFVVGHCDWVGGSLLEESVWSDVVYRASGEVRSVKSSEVDLDPEVTESMSGCAVVKLQGYGAPLGIFWTQPRFPKDPNEMQPASELGRAACCGTGQLVKIRKGGSVVVATICKGADVYGSIFPPWLRVASVRFKSASAGATCKTHVRCETDKRGPAEKNAMNLTCHTRNWPSISG